MEKVWDQKPEIQLWLMGLPSRSVRAYAQQHPQVHIPGYMPHIEVLNYAVYQRLVDFSARHSIKLVEFMAASVPVVSPSVTEALNVEVSHSGLIASDRDSFVRAVIEVASNKTLKQAYSEKGIFYAKGYSWESLASKYESQVLRHYLRKSTEDISP